jgi:hypothetical protein
MHMNMYASCVRVCVCMWWVCEPAYRAFIRLAYINIQFVGTQQQNSMDMLVLERICKWDFYIVLWRWSFHFRHVYEHILFLSFYLFFFAFSFSLYFFYKSKVRSFRMDISRLFFSYTRTLFISFFYNCVFVCVRLCVYGYYSCARTTRWGSACIEQ